MRWILDEIFADAGTTLDAHLTLEPLDILARHYWDRDGPLDLFADERASTDAIGRFAGAGEAHGYARFCERGRQIFETLDAPFMRASTPSMVKLIAAVGRQRPSALLGIDPFRTLWQSLGTYFKDPRLRQLFARYATYCGASPFQAPATLMLIAHVERLGVWSVRGGMHQLARVLADLAAARGVRFHYNARVRRIDIHGGRASGVRLDDDTHLRADCVLFGGDVAALSAGLLGSAVTPAVKARRSSNRSLSAITIATLADVKNFPLTRHTVFFSGDYRAEFSDIMGARRLPSDPTVYVCAQDRDGTDTAPAASPERLFCIVNAPASNDATPFGDQEINTCKIATCQTLARSGLTLTMDPDTSVLTTPAEYAQRFPGTGGALYGMASHGWRASFQRPSIVSRIPGLYLTGGSVHPGPGVPMAAMSGRLAASRIMQDLALMRRSTRVAMPGGISMR
jgi:1-hydroxycarotenoid 3,4-desaturase